MDSSLLANEQYTIQIRTLLQSIAAQPPINDPILLWDWTKYEICRVTRLFEKQLVTDRRHVEAGLNEELMNLMDRKDQKERTSLIGSLQCTTT